MARARGEVEALAKKVTVLCGDAFEGAYPQAWGAGIAVEFADGNRVEVSRDVCRGDPEAALSAAEMTDKARDLMAFGGLNDSGGVIEQVLAMAEGGNVPELSLL